MANDDDLMKVAKDPDEQKESLDESRDKPKESEDADIVEGEVVEDATGNLNPDQDKTNLVVQLEGLIKTHLSKTDKLREELAEQKAMLADAFENDPTYIEHAAAAKEANKIKSKTKTEIVKRPELAQIADKVKSMSSELKELNAALSDYLREYNQQSGISQIEGEDGELMEIVYVAKLVRKKS